MAGTTTNFAIPYPSVTDYVTNGATDMRLLAEKVDAVMSSGTPARNLLINGAMQINQRSASTAGITTSGYYTADRWKYAISSFGTWTQSVENDAPTGSGFRKSIKYLCTTTDASPAAGDLAIHHQIIEGQNLQAIRKGTASAQQVTISFWVKSNKTGTYILDFYDEDNARSCSKSYSILVASTWEYKSLTFPADTVGIFENDANSSAHIRWWLGAGSSYQTAPLQTTWGAAGASVAAGQVNLADTVNNAWQMTGAQLTVGSVSVPFEFKSFADDLRECLRYFWRHTSRTNDANITTALIYTGNLVLAPIFFPVPARSNAPTVTASSGAAMEIVYGTGVLASTAIAFGDSTNYTAQAAITIAGGIVGQAGLVRFSSSADYIQMSDEL